MWAGCQDELERNHLTAVLAQQFFALPGYGVGQLRGFAQLLRARGHVAECDHKRDSDARE